ncbi:serine hydrolase domain-containing protein [Rhizohabitans arisaemae]|uniref:serine hydrolase domain-containing protein n=1 Tax=Rhizohabitans arisaemae TaxID=2720610 RepID=UPI0024B05D6E|nr:serine hydrolase domain-containing protein [Rhizohabitans arisaemae]
MAGAVDPGRWHARLAELIAQYEIPGATLAFLHEGRMHEFAAGVLNVDTGVETTTDSIFQIGSITKVWTATQLMLLIEQGRLTLDTPVAEVLPEFKTADPEATKSVTVRHLLAHTSGIDGDLFVDTGRGDDCVEKYVNLFADLQQNHPVGATHSYCNSGFVLAGRVIEVLTGKSWDDALREQIIEPLGLTHTWTLPEDVLRFRAAMGHMGGKPAPQWMLPRPLGPAGLICATAADVVKFGAAHLGEGLLRRPEAMREPQVAIPNPYTLGPQWGIGWILDEWDGHRVFSHGGNTIGQAAMLWVLPDTGTVACLLLNGGDTSACEHAVAVELFAELAGVAVPPVLGPPAEPVTVDVERYAGLYERVGTRTEFTVRDGVLHMYTEATGAMAGLSPPMECDLIPVDDTTFVGKLEMTALWVSFVFYELPDGSPYVHFGVRATPKVA